MMFLGLDFSGFFGTNAFGSSIESAGTNPTTTSTADCTGMTAQQLNEMKKLISEGMQPHHAMSIVGPGPSGDGK